eukprot:COSAG01_NODE_20140_length_969_cov_0.973563_1_plen_50_part_01
MISEQDPARGLHPAAAQARGVGAAALPPRGRALSYTYSNIREEPPPRPHT